LLCLYVYNAPNDDGDDDGSIIDDDDDDDDIIDDDDDDGRLSWYPEESNFFSLCFLSPSHITPHTTNNATHH
jgi:hypothetical protein